MIHESAFFTSDEEYLMPNSTVKCKDSDGVSTRCSWPLPLYFSPLYFSRLQQGLQYWKFGSVRILLFLLLLENRVILAEGVFGLPRFRNLPTIDELAADYGASVSHIPVTTEDGYILTMHRIGNNSGPPVLLQHGLLNSADIWLTRTRDPDLVYFLLVEGYDVYLGNMRGNVFSRNHVRLQPSDPRFWDYSFHEVGYYDMPAMIDWILANRGLEQLYYVGHSLGTTVFFVMCSTRPEYNAKIKAGLMLSPVVYIPDKSEFSVPFVRIFFKYIHQFLRLTKRLHIFEILPRSQSFIDSIQDFCSYGRPGLDYCLDFFGNYLGEHRSNIDLTRMGLHLSYYFTGTSANTLLHLGQIFESERFDFLDLGPPSNQKAYNSTRPPPYPLEKVIAPVALFWSYNDNLASERSVGKLSFRLPNVILDRPNPDPKWTHVDVFCGLDAKEALYDSVIELMDSLK